MKHFNEWNQEKIEIDSNDEEDGKNDSFERPVIIIKKFNSRVVLVLPLSSKSGNKKFYFKVNYDEKTSFVILSQIRLISVKRLKRIVSVLSNDQFLELKNSFIRILK